MYVVTIYMVLPQKPSFITTKEFRLTTRSNKAVLFIGRFYVVIYVYILGSRQSPNMYAFTTYLFLLQKLSFVTKKEFRLTIGFQVIVYLYTVSFRLNLAGYKYTMYMCLVLNYIYYIGYNFCVVGFCVLFVYYTCIKFVSLLCLWQGTVQCPYTSGVLLLGAQVVCISGCSISLVYGALLCTYMYLLPVMGLIFGKILQNFMQILENTSTQPQIHVVYVLGFGKNSMRLVLFVCVGIVELWVRIPYVGGFSGNPVFSTANFSIWFCTTFGSWVLPTLRNIQGSTGCILLLGWFHIAGFWTVCVNLGYSISELWLFGVSRTWGLGP